MERRPPVKHTANRVAALETQILMRKTIADIHKIIKQTRGMIEDSRAANLRADAMLRVTPRDH